MALHRRLLPLLGALLLIAAALCLGPLAVRPATAAPVAAHAAARDAAHVAARDAAPAAACGEMLPNGGFETNDAWQLGVSPTPPQYVTSNPHSGSRALQLGVIGGANRLSFSSARQTITIPAGATLAQLSFFYYAVVTGAPGGDYMEMDVLSADGYSILDWPWYSQSDSRAWNQLFFDLSRWRGQTIQLYFNVFNDGANGTAGLLLDDVSLLGCTDGGPTLTPTPTGTAATGTPTLTPTPSPIFITGSPTTTPTPTPSPIFITASPTNTPNFMVVTNTPTPTPNFVVVTNTPTPGVLVYTATPGVVVYTATPPVAPATGAPIPSNCMDLIVDGGFEQPYSDAWWIAPNKIMPEVVLSPVHSGLYAMQLGSKTDNLYSYSSVRQQVTLPYGYNQLNLEFWAWTWAENPGGSDHQEAVLLEPDPAIIKKVWRGLFNEPTWKQHIIPLIQYAGRTVVVYFNVVNDGAGGRSGMYLDDVHLWACGQYGQIQTISGGAAPPPLPDQSGGQAVITQVVVQVTATAPVAPPGAAAPLASSAGGPTVNALDLTPTPVPPPSPTLAPVTQATPTATPAPNAVSQFWSAVRASLPGPWFIGMAIVVLAILGIIWIVNTR